MISTVLSLVNPITTSDLGVSSPNLTAYRAGYIVAAALAFIAAFLARRVPDADAAVTMVQRAKAPKEPVAAH
jgi:hypothetical protein